jgi:dTDP-4-amino-4,6-dideoxygalactose transaminase
MSFEALFEFERDLAEYTGAPYVVVTDGCTHALELCFRYDNIKETALTPYTYISIPMMLKQLGIVHSYYPDTLSHRQHWVGEYKFEATRIWDSARRLERNMYQPGMMQCLSFGHTKPLELGKGGAILTDDYDAYVALSKMRSDGRDLSISPWQEQKSFTQGYHYCPTLETCALGLEKLWHITYEPKYYPYPDLRTIDIS